MIPILRFLADLIGWLLFTAIGVAVLWIVTAEGYKAVLQSWREMMR